MSSRVKYSAYAVYPMSFRVSHKSVGKPPSSRQFKWVHDCASTVMDPEADIWNRWQISERDASTCTRISFHGYKRMLHTQTTAKGFKLSTRFWWGKEIVWSFYRWILGQLFAQGARICPNSSRVRIKSWRKFRRLWIKNSQLGTYDPKNFQFLVATRWDYCAHFWYAKVDLDWIGTCSKNSIFKGRSLRKTAGQRLTKLSITPGRIFLKSWEIHNRCWIW
jgi:hypothetical protein